MGLGKTIQVISFLAAVLHKKGLEVDLDATRPECVKKVNKNSIFKEQREKKISQNNFFF
jgi:SNF2 family DNA or RNA helicase